MVARIAGERSPSNDPEIVSLLPAKTAFSEPEPVTVGSIVASTGTVDSRALKDSPFCATAEHAASNITAPIIAALHLCRFSIGGKVIRLAPSRHLTPTVHPFSNADLRTPFLYVLL